MTTLDQSTEVYTLAHKAGWKNTKRTNQWTDTFNIYASPVVGYLAVAEMNSGLVVICLAPIWESKNGQSPARP